MKKFPDFEVITNLIVFCLSIGIFEEVLFRGWVQNKFIEKYGNKRKGVILSIILSSIIFSVFHSANIFTGQGTLLTIVQVIQTLGIGIYLGSVYYRTKNIWNVILLHGIYDFSIMLANANYLTDPITGNAVGSFLTLNVCFSVILGLIYAISSFLILRKSKIKHLIEEETETIDDEVKNEHKVSKELTVCLVILFVIIFAIGFIPKDAIPEYNEHFITFEYKEKNIGNFITSYFYNEAFEMNYKENSRFKIYCSDNYEKIIIENINTKDNIYLTINNSVLPMNRCSLEVAVIENEDNFWIIYYDSLSNQMKTSSKVYYLRIPKSSISNKKSFLDNLENNVKIFDVPKIDDIGYLTTDNSNYKYALINSTTYDKFIIDENDEIYVLSDN